MSVHALFCLFSNFTQRINQITLLVGSGVLLVFPWLRATHGYGEGTRAALPCNQQHRATKRNCRCVSRADPAGRGETQLPLIEQMINYNKPC